MIPYKKGCTIFDKNQENYPIGKITCIRLHLDNSERRKIVVSALKNTERLYRGRALSVIRQGKSIHFVKRLS